MFLPWRSSGRVHCGIHDWRHTPVLGPWSTPFAPTESGQEGGEQVTCPESISTMMTLYTTLPSCPFGTPRRPPLPAHSTRPALHALSGLISVPVLLLRDWTWLHRRQSEVEQDRRQQGLGRRVDQSDGYKLNRVMSKQDGYAPLVPLVRVHGKRLCCLNTPTIPFATCTCRLDLHLFRMTLSLASSYKRTSREAACAP